MSTAKKVAIRDKDEFRREDTPEKPLTGAEIVAKARPKTVRTPVPADTGIYIGSGVYANRGRMKMSGFCFTYWEPDKLDYDEIIDLCAKEGIGNTLQFWQSEETLLDLAKKAKARGLFTTCIYSGPEASQSRTAKGGAGRFAGWRGRGGRRSRGRRPVWA